MLCMLIAYAADGSVIATKDYLVKLNPEGEAVGLVDFAAHEAAGGKLRDIWDVQGATGSGTWPEWLGAQAHDFTVELGPDKRIAALRHRKSGVKRKRADIEAAIAAVEPDARGRKDIRHLVGGPGRPLRLDGVGRTLPAAPRVVPDLPTVGAETFMT
jgi:hypothetical protein